MKDIDVMLALALAAAEHGNDADVIQRIQQVTPRASTLQRQDILRPIMMSRNPVQAVWQKADAFLPNIPCNQYHENIAQ